MYSWNLIVRALDTGFDLPFLRFLSLPGASDLTDTGCSCSRVDIDAGGGDAMEDIGLSVDVLEANEQGEASIDMGNIGAAPVTLWQSSSYRFAVSCFTVICCCCCWGMGGGGGGGVAAAATVAATAGAAM